MDRILNENRWALPVHKQENKRVKNARSFGLIVSILILVGISVSFIFMNPVTSEHITSINENKNKITTVNNIDFAKTYSNLEFDVIQEGTIASIGEPVIYQPDDGNKATFKTILIFGILGLSLITLVFSWRSTEKK